MRVCLIGGKIFPPWDSALSSVGRDLVKILSRHVDLTVITGYHSPQIYGKVYGCYNQEYYDTEGIFKQANVMLLELSENVLIDYISFWKKMAECIKDKRFDVIHLLGIPWIPTTYPLISHLLTLPDPRALKNTLWYRYLCSRFINRLFVSSNLIRNALASLDNRLRISVIPPPVDTSIYKPSTTCKELQWLGDFGGSLILYLGPIFSQRFPALIVLRAIAKLRERGYDVTLLIVASMRHNEADRPYIGVIRDLIDKLKLSKSVKLQIKVLTEKEKVMLYNLADVILYLPLNEVELADPPITVLEAMSCGRRVIATDVMSLPEIITDGFNGFMIKRPDLTDMALADKIEEALSKKIVAEEVRKTIKDGFSLDEVAKRLLHSYNELMNEESRRW
jgi:glycosyltransferase involved in cell wall biosynthesis